MGEESHFSEPYIGLVVNNIDETYDVYNKYALHLGFSIRKMKRRVDKFGNVTIVNYACSKEGYAIRNTLLQERRVEKLETRTGCKASIRFQHDRTNKCWKVISFISEHNHDLAKAEEVRFLRSAKNIDDSQHSFIPREFGGEGSIDFGRRDCFNLVDSQRLQLIEASDVQSLMNLFRNRQENDPLFFYSFQVDKENRLTNVFWRDGISRFDYQSFGDVVVFDTTYRTNKYNMICAPFVGINHHWKNVLLGCAFLLDETIDSFVWLFETFLESMGGQPPKTIFTDQDEGMSNAISQTFDRTRHCLSIWLISKNASQHLSSLYASQEFKRCFNECLYYSNSVDEFEELWKSMIVRFHLEEHEWLKYLYDLRAKWCPAYSMDSFSAGIRSIERSENMNNVFHCISTKTMHLTEFVLHYEKMTDQMREVELEENFRCYQGIPLHVSDRGPMFIEAAKLYTRTMFKHFELEISTILAIYISSEWLTESHHYFRVGSHGNKSLWEVSYDLSFGAISCSCHKFESFGILCRHALRVLVAKNIDRIPSQYILPRWTKMAKYNTSISSDHTKTKMDEKTTESTRRNEMMREAYKMVSLGAETSIGSKIVKEKISEALCMLGKEMNKNNLGENSSVLVPSFVRPKRLPKERLKNYLEKKKKRKNKNTKEDIIELTNQPINLLNGEGLQHHALNDFNFNKSNTQETPFNDVHGKIFETHLDQSSSQINLEVNNGSFDNVRN